MEKVLATARPQSRQYKQIAPIGPPAVTASELRQGHMFAGALWAGALVLAAIAPPASARTAAYGANRSGAVSPARLQRWGAAVVRRTSVFRISGTARLSGSAVLQSSGRRYVSAGGGAVTWANGVELFMLTAATRCNHAYAPALWRFVQTLAPYWRTAHGVGGYDVASGHGPVDRYYDDNEWLVIGFMAAYRATGNAQYLRLAARTFRFVASGDSSQLGGGIFWHEEAKTSKNTCSNGPAIVGALELYRATHQKKYLNAARRLYHWVNRHLQDRHDGLYFDNINLRHDVNKMQWSYNTGIMIQADVLFYKITRRRKYLARARRLARAAEKRWIDPVNHAMRGPGRFAVILIDALGSLYRVDHSPRQRIVLSREF